MDLRSAVAVYPALELPAIQTRPHQDSKSKTAQIFNMATIMLQSSDGQTYEVDLEIAKEFGTIRTMLDVLGIEGNSERMKKEMLPLPNINSKILKIVIEYAKICNQGIKALKLDGPMEDFLADSLQFLKNLRGFYDSELTDLMKAADYLDINSPEKFQEDVLSHPRFDEAWKLYQSTPYSNNGLRNDLKSYRNTLEIVYVAIG